MYYELERIFSSISCPSKNLLTPGSTYDAPETLDLKSATFASSSNESDWNTFKSEYVSEK